VRIIIRLIINFLLASAVIIFFRHIEWINFTNPPEILANESANTILLAGIIGLIIFLMGEIAGLVYSTFVVLTCGLACIIFPIYLILLGYIKLIATQIILDDWFDFDRTLIKAAIISLAIGAVRIPSRRERKKIIIHDESQDS